jgi:4-amino-4-deoxy-L-arabinose transferase-like glycosyltransferase
MLDGREPFFHQSLAAAEAWLRRHRCWVIGVVLGLSLLIRLAYFLEYSVSPVATHHLWDQTDMYFYDAWGRSIAAGDLLTDKPFHSVSMPFQAIAESYFVSHPEEARELGSDRNRLLWDRWYGGKLFHQEPLYPLLIGLTYRVFGPDPRWVYAWQMGLGAVSNLLVYLLARRYFGDLVGAVAGGMAVFCGPLLYYDLVLLRTSLAVFSALGIVWLLERAAERRSWRTWLVTGLGCGAALMLQSTFLFLILPLLAILAVRRRHEWRQFAREAAVLGAGTALALLPVAARNIAVGAPVLGLSAVGPVVFLFSNVSTYDPARGFAVEPKGAARILAATDGRLLPTVVEALRTHSSPWSYLRQLGGKLSVAWHWFEVPNNTSFYHYRLYSFALRGAFVTFAIVGPLGLLGLGFAGTQVRRYAIPMVLVAATLAPMLAFYVLSRFRAPMLAALLPFSALALVRLLDRGWTRSAALWWTAAAVAFLWTARPLRPDVREIRSVDYLVGFKQHYEPRVSRAFEAKDWHQALALLNEALSVEPAEVRQMSVDRPPEDEEGRRLARAFAAAHGLLSEAFRASGGRAGAAHEAQRARELLEAAEKR